MTDRTPQEQVEVVRNRLAFLLVGAFVGALIDFTLFPVPASNKDIITYMVGQLSGMALMALGLYFTKNAGQETLDAKRTDNTGAAFRAIEATAKGGTTDTGVAGDAADEVVDAAADKADEIKGKKP